MLRNFIEFIKEESEFNYISEIIDSECRKTKNFGLEIDNDDVNIEKEAFIEVFKQYSKNIVDCSSDIEYNSLRRKVSEILSNHLLPLLKKYYNMSVDKNLSVKNMYNCHLDSCISTIFLYISNNIKKFKSIDNDVKDYFTDFCDTHHLDISVDDGYICNGGWIPDSFLLNIDLDSKNIKFEKCYRISFIPQTHRYRHDLVEFGDISNVNKMNSDLKYCLDRIEDKMGLKSLYETNIRNTFWSFTLYLS